MRRRAEVPADKRLQPRCGFTGKQTFTLPPLPFELSVRQPLPDGSAQSACHTARVMARSAASAVGVGVLGYAALAGTPMA